MKPLTGTGNTGRIVDVHPSHGVHTLAANYTEDDLLGWVLGLARLWKIRTAHFRPARLADGSWRTAVAGDGKGFVDLVLVGPGGVLFRELKSERGRLSKEQLEWSAVLTAAGANVGLWRPSDWMDRTIHIEMGGIR